MNKSDTNKKKFTQPKHITSLNAVPVTNKAELNLENSQSSTKPQCPLLAKDSEWVDILQTSHLDSGSSNNNTEKVDCEEGFPMKPLALMFPGLLENDPAMLEGMITKVMSTTEVTKHLVGHKANFAFMKKVERLIPPDKKWLESLTENRSSCCSLESMALNYDLRRDYEADTESTDDEMENVDQIKK